MLRGFKNFLMRGDVIVVAVGLVTALAFSTLIKAFTDSVINPVIARLQGGKSVGLGWQLGAQGNSSTYLNIGSFIAALIYFIIFMAVIYFLIVVPYKFTQARRGVEAFGEPGPVKTCPECLAEDIPGAARKCRYCGSDQPRTSEPPEPPRTP
ncbi:MscL family protein [Streptomyces malaysiensis]|nr:MscL family protein [Streptomyces malaysiensis]